MPFSVPIARTVPAILAGVILFGGGHRAIAQEPASPAPQVLPTVPERFFQVQDEAGFLWQALDTGALISGETQYLQSGLNIIVDGEPFQAQSAAVSEPKSEAERITVRLGETRETVELSRDLWFDLARSGVRVWDTLTNPGPEERTYEVVLRTTYPFSWQSLHGSGGTALASEPVLRPQDHSLGVHFSPAEGRHDTYFLFGSEKGGLRPELKVSANSRELAFEYAVTVPPGQSRGLLHWILQRNLPDVSGEAGALAPFVERGLWLDAGIEGKNQTLVANLVPEAFPSVVVPAAGLKSLVALNGLMERLGLYRRSEDVLWLGPSNGIAGDLSREGSIQMLSSPWGEVELPLKNVAGIRGGSGEGRAVTVYLRDGRAYTGEITGGDLRWTTKGAAAETLDGERFHLLLLATETEDGTAPTGTTHFLEMANGSVLALGQDPAGQLDWSTPWGPDAATWGNLVELAKEKNAAAWWRVRLASRSVSPVILPPGFVAVNPVAGAALEVPADAIERIWSAGSELLLRQTEGETWIDFSEVPAGLAPEEGLLLRGNQLIAGGLAPGPLTLNEGNKTTRLETSRIASLVRSDDPSAPERIEVVLVGGERLSGVLLEPLLSLSREGGNLEIPTELLIAYRTKSTP